MPEQPGAPNPPPRLPRPPLHDRERRWNRRQYALLPLASGSEHHGTQEYMFTSRDHTTNSESSDLQTWPAASYEPRAAVPNKPVPRNVNTTNRARRNQRAFTREPAVMGQSETETFHDITPLLSEPEQNTAASRAKKTQANSDNIPDMTLEEDDNVDNDFEIVERGISEHNGTDRKWYRLFRH